MTYYTYAWLREDGTPYYVGKGKGNRAYQNHKKFRPPPRGRILILKSHMTEEEAFKHEKYMIFVFGRKDLGTGVLWNFTDGGEGTSGVVLSRETREKISSNNRKREVSKETREKISRNSASRREEVKKKISEANKKRTVSEETRKKISEINKSRGEETRKKISEANKRRVVSQETRKKISENNPSRREEVRKKISETHKRKHSEKEL